MKTNNVWTLWLVGLLGLGLAVVWNSVFIVNPVQQILVLRFGQVQRVVTTTGVWLKVPFLDDLVVYEKRLLGLSPPPFEVLLSDKKRIIMDLYARYQINDPVAYYERVRTEDRLRDLLGRSMNAGLRRVIATVALTELLSVRRDALMRQVLLEVKEQATTLGIDVVDLRFSRTDLPLQTSQAVYSRMRAEREREAREARAQGQEISQKIRSTAEKERAVMLSQARGEATRIRGEAEAMQNRILSEAYSEDPEFYRFYQSLEKYRQALTDGRTSLIFDTQGDFFRYFTQGATPPVQEESATATRPRASSASGASGASGGASGASNASTSGTPASGTPANETPANETPQ